MRFSFDRPLTFRRKSLWNEHSKCAHKIYEPIWIMAVLLKRCDEMAAVTVQTKNEKQMLWMMHNRFLNSLWTFVQKNFVSEMLITVKLHNSETISGSAGKYKPITCQHSLWIFTFWLTSAFFFTSFDFCSFAFSANWNH